MISLPDTEIVIVQCVAGGDPICGDLRKDTHRVLSFSDDGTKQNARDQAEMILVAIAGRFASGPLDQPFAL